MLQFGTFVGTLLIHYLLCHSVCRWYLKVHSNCLNSYIVCSFHLQSWLYFLTQKIPFQLHCNISFDFFLLCEECLVTRSIKECVGVKMWMNYLLVQEKLLKKNLRITVHLQKYRYAEQVICSFLIVNTILWLFSWWLDEKFGKRRAEQWHAVKVCADSNVISWSHYNDKINALWRSLKFKKLLGCKHQSHSLFNTKTPKLEY